MGLQSVNAYSTILPVTCHKQKSQGRISTERNRLVASRAPCLLFHTTKQGETASYREFASQRMVLVWRHSWPVRSPTRSPGRSTGRSEAPHRQGSQQKVLQATGAHARVGFPKTNVNSERRACRVGEEKGEQQGGGGAAAGQHNAAVRRRPEGQGGRGKRRHKGTTREGSKGKGIRSRGGT